MRKFLKWSARILAGLVLLVGLALAYLWFQAGRKMNRVYTWTPPAIAIPTDSTTLAEGRRLATVYCAHCHREDFGGGPFIADALAEIDAPNLTPGKGSAVASYSDADWIRTIRHGIKKDGRSLIVMPATSFWRLSDADLGAIVGYLKSAPPIDRAAGRRELNLLGTVLVGAGAFDNEFSGAVIDHAAARPGAPARTASPELGEYMMQSFGCHHCHGDDFTGRQPPDPKAPFAPNLTQAGALKAWNEELFLQMARTRPGTDMPWSALRAMTDDELRSIWRHLGTLPAKPTPKKS